MYKIIIGGVEHISGTDKIMSIMCINGCTIQFEITQETTIKLLRVINIHDQSFVEAVITI